MKSARRPRSLAARLSIVSLVGLSLSGTSTAQAVPHEPGTPTQEQVDAARAATGTATRAVAEIDAAYAAARAQLDLTHREAAVASEAANAAQLRLTEATRAAQAASAEVDRTATAAHGAAKSVRQYAAQVYASHGGLDELEAYLSSGGPQQVADRAAALDTLGQARRQSLADAAMAANAATEAKRRADTAAVQLRKAATDASQAQDAASAAADRARAASDRLDIEQQGRLAHLANLRNTTVELEQARQDGLARVAAAQEAARQAEVQRIAAEQAALRASAESARVAALQEAANAAAAATAAQQAAEQARQAALAAQAAAAPAPSPVVAAPTPAPAPAAPTPTPAPAAPPPAPAPPPPPTVPAAGNRQAVLNYAYAQLGKPYVWGAAGPNAFDCSGLTMMSYRQIGIYLDHYTGSQYNAGTKVPIAQLLPGDLVFFGPSGPTSFHVGVYIGNNQMIHAPNSNSVVRIDNIYWLGQLVPYGTRY